MFKFFKESIREFDHVVWPTNKETKNYFVSVTSIIVALTLLLYIIGTFFSTALLTAKEIINPAKIIRNTTTSASTGATIPTSGIKIDPNSIKATTTPVVPTTKTK